MDCAEAHLSPPQLWENLKARLTPAYSAALKPSKEQELFHKEPGESELSPSSLPVREEGHHTKAVRHVVRHTSEPLL